MVKSKPKRSAPAGRVPPVRGMLKSLRVEYVVPEPPPPGLYANQLLVQSDGRATYLSFYQAQPPIILGDEGDVQRQIDELSMVKAHLVAQIVIPQDRMESFIEVMTDNFHAQAQTRVDNSNQGAAG